MRAAGNEDKPVRHHVKIKQTTRGIERRNEIVRATKVLLVNKGINNIGIRDISECAEIPISSIYNLFENIDDIYRAVIEDIWSEFTKYREDQLRERYATFLELVEHSTRINFEYIKDNELMRKTIYSKHVTPSIKDADNVFIFREITQFVSRHLPYLSENQFERTVELIRKQILIFDALISDILKNTDNLKTDDLDDILDIILKISN